MTHELKLWQLLVGALTPLLLAGLWAEQAQAQPDAMRWGDISDEHAAMEGYPADSLASAVILGNYAEVRIEDDLSMIYDVHRRIKLFNESAYDLATVEFRYVHRQRSQRVQRLDGQTFVRNADGSLRRVQLQRSDIFEEEDGDFTRVRFTLPALEPGAIIEYRYRIQSEYAETIPDFLFQSTEPTLVSEYRARYPAYLTINRHPLGSPIFDVEEIDERPFRADQVQWVATVRRRAPRGALESGIQTERTYRPVNIPTTSLRWVMRDVPAIREEPFVASIWNHAYGMQFQLAGYTGADAIFRPLSESWQDVAVRLRRHDDFGRRLSAPRAVRNQVAELIADANSETEKMQAVYDFVRSSIVWDDRYRLYARRSLNNVLDTRSGSSAEVNILLIAMLREAGVEANPVLVSTRRNGRALGWFASTRQFNHVIATARAGGQEFFLDATDRYRPANMLPVQALNEEGWRLSDDSFGWIPIRPGRSVSALEVEGTITAEGGVSGTLGARLEGYPALRLRHRLSAATDEDERREAVAGDDARTYTALVVDGLEEDGEIRAELGFEWDEHGQQMAHLLTFNPIIAGALEENPFTLPERTYPVDFAYPIMRTYSATFRIPDDYVVDELPSHVRLSTPGNGIRYARVVTFAGGRLRVQRTLDISQTQFAPSEYEALRELYEQIVLADAAMVVLARRGGPAE